LVILIHKCQPVNRLTNDLTIQQLKILITGGKTATALKLAKAFDGKEILLGDYGDMPNINSSSYSFVELGEWNVEVLAHNLLTKCLDYGVDILLPLYEAEIVALSKSLVLFEEFSIKILLPETPQFDKNKYSHWAVFDDGELLYTSVENSIENNDNLKLKGAYYINNDTRTFNLISISNPE